MNLLKAFLVAFGMILGMISAIYIGSAIDTYLEKEYSSYSIVYWAEFKQLVNTNAYEIVFINPKVIRIGSFTPHFIAQVNSNGEDIELQLRKAGWILNDDVYKKSVNNTIYILKVTQKTGSLEFEMFADSDITE
ncbi:hypothetical protein VEHSUH05_03390 [Veillonella denticariosi JCM 15641]|uniref:Uncharacterized protein n=1 Tax=Veillonella denticariosi JCM 15641 TaxID=1298594 RepID=A0A2S7ZA05_9FIRM|nr:hypothetical protein [Veillonella denticariosi]PQL20126.1 hypothetical protein VEHSUH05_03390 [Veillonella denticariosi JCM 15641]